jgi:hypothetical protein
VRHRAPSACPGPHRCADGRASDSGADRERGARCVLALVPPRAPRYRGPGIRRIDAGHLRRRAGFAECAVLQGFPAFGDSKNRERTRLRRQHRPPRATPEGLPAPVKTLDFSASAPPNQAKRHGFGPFSGSRGPIQAHRGAPQAHRAVRLRCACRAGQCPAEWPVECPINVRSGLCWGRWRTGPQASV